MINYIWVGIGGILGSLARYYLGIYVSEHYPNRIPWGTLLINVTGAFILAFLAFYTPFHVSNQYTTLKYLIMTGFLGAYTTFSTFCLESYQLLEDKEYQSFSLYIIGTLFLGLLAAYLGALIGKMF